MSSCSSCIETTLMLGVQPADVSIRCSSHPQGWGWLRLEHPVECRQVVHRD